MPQPQLILFTDLDGTLLDHHNYSWEAARPALQLLREQHIPLILCTSKTAAEVSRLHQELQLSTPFIVENGSGIILSPDMQSAHFFGRPYSELINLVHQLRQQHGYKFKGFADFSIAEISAITGLSVVIAELAKQRLCSEPIRWDDDPTKLEEFRNHLTRHGLQLLRGGRFYHIVSNSTGKGTALRWLLKHQPAPANRYWYSVALGDGPNDQSMLEAADLAVIIPSVSGVSPNPQNVSIIHATEQGPAGWNQTVCDILQQYNKE
ncbi:mannosyl-3-phosphoglycerate phosphatase [Desulfuromusa kysingii]|uniref:Mannosyl-3-phosphoglycerate phosphatase n=1 Tax=Desulfuromusa kysingii TaxID=37625 RepID=A0A1H4AVS6_9BACT|nr:HAD-IIB family hydrolase [Desulfuromusa kysingii]SEA39981.1 mannosyl-3-phosphoglycerate phosphatase [Desulfuromusa kysingii]